MSQNNPDYKRTEELLTILQTQKEMEKTDNVWEAHSRASRKVRGDMWRSNVNHWKRIFSDKYYAIALLILMLVICGVAVGAFFLIKGIMG